jgi:signal transduction histidine kinase/response regulator of citrate/malate metabolism
MRKHLLEIIIVILIISGAALVLATGYFSYKGISSIVATISKEAKPDNKLMLIRDIAAGLEQADNSIRVFGFTGDESDLKPYRKLLDSIDIQIEQLRNTSGNDGQFQTKIDSITILIEQKFAVWNEMITLYNSNVALQFLDTISEQLESKVESDSLRKNRSFLKKIFKRQKKEELDEESLIKNIEQFREEDKQYAMRIKSKEQQLSSTNRQLTLRLFNLINKIKSEERQARLIRAKKAEQLADETYYWIGWFTLSGTLSALVVILVVSIYIRKTRASQKSLIKSKAEAENLAKAKESFVANISHEIRTPMNVISGFVNQLLAKPLDETTNGIVEIIKSSSDHLVRIINDVLDFSKLQAGKMKLEPTHFKVQDLMNEIGLLFEKQAADKNNTLVINKSHQLPDVLYGDPVRLKQILINLIGNAIKFTNSGLINAELDADEIKNMDFKLILTVKDNGIGIDKDNLEKIFEDFTQADNNSARKYGGTGLGLSIVKKITEIHQGTIEVDSQKNMGSSFIVRLPYKKGDSAKTEDIKTQTIKLPEGLNKKHILIVDDEIYNRKLIGTILKRWEVPFDEAEDGKETIEKIKKNPYDLILMDVNMPDTNGVEVARIIRNSLKIPSEKTAIVLTTATTFSPEEINDYKSMGIDGYLPKPFSENELLGIINETLFPEEPEQDVYGSKKVTSYSAGDKIVNLDELNRFAGNDQNFVQEMLQKFMESFEKGINEMKASLETDYQKAGHTAHKLASPSRHIGAEILVKTLKEIEAMDNGADQIETIRSKIDILETDYKKVKDQIILHLENISNQTGK